jgi:hypothetical protein
MSPEDPPPKDDELVAPDTYEGDASWLKKNFAGKTRAEAIRMFEQRAAANIADDYLWMSHIGLAYYLPAALSYLKSPTSEGDDGFLDWITTALSVRCENDDQLPAEIRQVIRDIADHLKGQLHKFTSCKHPEHVPIEYLSRLEAMSKPD